MEEEFRPLLEMIFSSAWGDAVVWFGGLWAVLLFIRKVFKDADDELDPEKRQSLAEDLADKKTWASGSWVPDFTLVFDRFFGKKHLRWRCIYRSILISVFTFTMLFLVLGMDLISAYDDWEISVVKLIPAVVISNGIGDYLSLLETRFLLKTNFRTSEKILYDVFLTTLMSLVWWSIAFWAVGRIEGTDVGYSDAVEAILGIVLNEGTSGDILIVQIGVATSFTTSVWLWLHGLAQLTIRGLGAAAFLMSWLNVKERPLRAIGTTINAFVLLIGVVLFPVFVIAG